MVLPHRPFTRDCACWIRTVPWGTLSAARHIPTLSLARTWFETTLLRIAVTIHWMRMQGWGVPGGSVNGQPAIVNVSVDRRVYAPSDFMRMLEQTTLTLPPCGHCMTLA